MADALSAAAEETARVRIEPGGNSHPTLALLLLASGEPARLALALKTVTRPCQDFGVRLVVIWPGSLSVLRAVPETAEVEAIAVALESSPADRRRAATGQVQADLLMFVEEPDVERQAWADVLSSRVGVLRDGNLDELRTDWRARLLHLGVEPG